MLPPRPGTAAADIYADACTVGILDATLTMFRLLRERRLTGSQAVRRALLDLAAHDATREVLGIARALPFDCEEPT